MSPIITSHVYPPIPDRRFDWAAYRDPEGIQGEGPTEAAAVADFIEQEREACDHPGEDIANGRHVCPDCGHEWDITYDPPGDY